MQMTEYVVVEAGWVEELQRRVQERLSQGWKLAGGVAVTFFPPSDPRCDDDTNLLYSQAMTR